jgi:hypothetical protein
MRWLQLRRHKGTQAHLKDIASLSSATQYAGLSEFVTSRLHSLQCWVLGKPSAACYGRHRRRLCARPCSNSTPELFHHTVIRFTENHHLYVQQPSTRVASPTPYTLKYTPFKKTGYLKIKQSKCESARATIPPQHFRSPQRLWLAAPPLPAPPVLPLRGSHRPPPWQSSGYDCLV